MDGGREREREKGKERGREGQREGRREHIEGDIKEQEEASIYESRRDNYGEVLLSQLVERANFVSILVSDFLSPEMCVVEARHSDSPRKGLWSEKAFYQRQGADTAALWPVTATEMKGLFSCLR